jgi:ABC-type phosphate transport system ATPase subunit
MIAISTLSAEEKVAEQGNKIIGFDDSVTGRAIGAAFPKGNTFGYSINQNIQKTANTASEEKYKKIQTKIYKIKHGVFPSIIWTFCRCCFWVSH